MIELLPLEELAGWPLTDDPEIVTEADIDIAAEVADADEQAEHDYLESPRFCCGGRNINCGGHWRWSA